jgi:hypothetical protein
MDHDSSDGRVVSALRDAGFDVLTTFDADNQDHPDPDQLAFALDQGRILYSANVPDYARINRDWARAGRVHAGIVLRSFQSMPIGDQVRALTRLCTELSEHEMRGRIEYLRAWLD